LKNKRFDVILTNPPFSAGKKVCIEMIKQSHEHLNKNGLFQLIAPHNKGGESLKKIMLAVFNNVGELEKKRGYRVYISMKK
jgi:16S rRNA G1207 methylase RsmC